MVNNSALKKVKSIETYITPYNFETKQYLPKSLFRVVNYNLNGDETDDILYDKDGISVLQHYKTSFVYDEMNNLLQRKSDDLVEHTCEFQNYTYDNQNRMTTFIEKYKEAGKKPVITKSEVYEYYSDGRLMEKTVNLSDGGKNVFYYEYQKDLVVEYLNGIYHKVIGNINAGEYRMEDVLEFDPEGNPGVSYRRAVRKDKDGVDMFYPVNEKKPFRNPQAVIDDACRMGNEAIAMLEENDKDIFEDIVIYY